MAFSRPHQRHCGTGIWPDRDIVTGWRGIETACGSLPTWSRSQPRTPAQKAGVLDLRKPCGRETDSPLERDGFELSVPPRRRTHSSRQFCSTFPALPLQEGPRFRIRPLRPRRVRSNPADVAHDRPAHAGASSIPFYPYKDTMLRAISATRRRSSKGSSTSASVPSLIKSAAA